MKRIVPVIVWDGNHGTAPDGCRYEIYSEQSRYERRWWGVRFYLVDSGGVSIGPAGASRANLPGRRGILVDGTPSGEQTAKNFAERHYARHQHAVNAGKQ